MEWWGMVFENANVQPHIVYPVYEKQLFYLTSHIKTKHRLVLPVIYYLSRLVLLGTRKDQLLQKFRVTGFLDFNLVRFKDNGRPCFRLAVQHLLQPGERLLGSE
jgi:hypothetical protein